MTSQRLIVSDSFKTFIETTREESKVSRLLFNALTICDTKKREIYERNINGDTINFLTFRKEGTISFLPKGKELKYTEDHEWSREGRQEGKPARIVAQVLSPTAMRLLTLRDLEVFNNLYKGHARAFDLSSIKTASGLGLWEVYKKVGRGFSSCMFNASTEKLAIYVENPQAVEVWYIENERGEILARALCWTGEDEQGNRAQIVDRVYGCEDYVTLFRKLAQERGAYKKQCDSAGESEFFKWAENGERSTMCMNFTIRLKGGENTYDYFPFIDTFQFFGWDKQGARLTNNEYCEFSFYELTCTDGGHCDRRGRAVYGRNGFFDEDDTRWAEHLGEYIHEDDAISIGDEYFYSPHLETAQAFNRGRRNYVLMEDCEEVECFQADDFSGTTCVDDISTFTCYKDDGERLYDEDEAIEVYVLDGEIVGESDY